MNKFLKKSIFTVFFILLGVTCLIVNSQASQTPTLFMDSPDNHQVLGLAFYDGNYWIATSAAGGTGPSFIHKVDQNGNLLTPYTITSTNLYINGLAVDNSGSLYSFDQFNDRMIKHDTDIVSAINTHSGPYGGSAGPRTLAYGMDHLWGITNSAQQELFKIDPGTLGILTTYTRPVGLTGITWVGENLWAVAWGSDGNGYLYQLTQNGQQFEIQDSWIIEGIAHPYALTFDGVSFIFSDHDAPKIYKIYISSALCQGATIKPHTFLPATPAKASEVNENFDILYEQINNLSCEIETLKAIVCQDHPELDICK